MDKEQVTERDIRLPEFRDAKLEDLEFDGSGEVVRKDRFEKSMRKIQGMLHGVNGLSARSSWTCDQVVEAVNITLLKIKRLDEIFAITYFAPADAVFYCPSKHVYVKNINKEHLAEASKKPEQSLPIDFESYESAEWESDSGFLEYINALMVISELKDEFFHLISGSTTV